MRVSIAIFLLLASNFASTPSTPADTVWPQFRGAFGRGVAEINSLPISWSTTKNVAWRASVPGRGWSSPIVWRDQVILTSTLSPGTFKPPSTGIYGNDYIAELMKQGLSDDEVLAKLRARDIESTAEAGELQYMLLFRVPPDCQRSKSQRH